VQPGSLLLQAGQVWLCGHGIWLVLKVFILSEYYGRGALPALAYIRVAHPTPEPRVWCCGALHHGAVIVPAARRPQMMRELAGAPLGEAGSGGHLAIAQLVDSRFNRCKSALRVTESWALGLPVIASDVTPFRDVIEHGVTGMLCRSAEDWTKALTELEHDGAMRMELARNGRLKARGLVITKHAQEWEAAYHSV
jgi:glycosyltransferase involved in cell wall biosynthesis